MLAEELGFYGVQFGEHLGVSLEAEAAPTGAIWYDNFVIGAHLATLTKELRLIFSALVVPFRHPLLAAKLIATLDVVSRGRVIVNMAVGWNEREFEVLGIPFNRRGAITEEYIRAMKSLWTDERPEFHGRFVDIGDIDFSPKCVQKPHVPVWIAGDSPQALRRAAELGDGWCPNRGTPAEFAESIPWIKERALEVGRDPTRMAFGFSIGIGDLPEGGAAASGGRYFPAEPADTPDKVIALVQRYNAVGVHHLSLRFVWDTPRDFMRRMEWFVKEIMPAFNTNGTAKRSK